jgi:hypothetical protein
LLSDPGNRVTIVVRSDNLFYDAMPAEERELVWNYIHAHFDLVPGLRDRVYHRIRWDAADEDAEP